MNRPRPDAQEPTPQPHTRARGRIAEDSALAWLERQGYETVERNHANRAGEIDLIARDGDTLCFIEVKSRADVRYGPAVSAVSHRKQARLARVAALYLAQSGWRGPCRFDVLGLESTPEGWRFDLIRHAFEVPPGLF